MIKQRQESVELYDKGGRAELAAQEREEIAIISAYLPKQMSDDDVKAAIAAAIAETGAAGMKDMGKVIAALKAKYAGQMDFGKASGLVKAALIGVSSSGAHGTYQRHARRLSPGIHVLQIHRAGKNVDGRDKPGHDEANREVQGTSHAHRNLRLRRHSIATSAGTSRRASTSRPRAATAMPTAAAGWR